RAISRSRRPGEGPVPVREFDFYDLQYHPLLRIAQTHVPTRSFTSPLEIIHLADTDNRNPASKFLLHVLGAAAQFGRELIRSAPRLDGSGTCKTIAPGGWERRSAADPERTLRHIGPSGSLTAIA